MDPQAYWQRFLDACDIGDREGAYHVAVDLRGWLLGGGARSDGVPSLGAVCSLVDWLERKDDE